MKIYNAHGWYFNARISDKKRKFYVWIEKILALKTNMIVNISKDELVSALKYKIAPKNKMCIIENGIDFSKFNNFNDYRTQIRDKYKVKNDEILIGQVGRLSEQKDPLTLIKAFKKINQINPKTKLMYIGAGELEENVKQFSIDNEIEENIIITGWTKNVEQYISALDIATLNSKWERFWISYP